MIATLEGVVEELGLGRIVLNVRGVGYGVYVTSADEGTLSTGKSTKLHIYEHIRESAHDLFGFCQKSTKELFVQLLSVKNVGPKVALAVMDIGTSDVVRAAIAGGEVKTLQSAKGVGKRAAEQIIVELRDKVGQPVGEDAEHLITRSGLNTSDEAVQGLVALGYTEADAQAALQGIDKKLPTEDRVKLALKGK